MSHAWQTQTVKTPEGWYTPGLNACWDATNIPHLAWSLYAFPTGGGVFYANGNGWSVETVEADAGWNADIAVDSTGQAYVIYSKGVYAGYRSSPTD